MVPLRRWSGYANRGRPDADDDADANEQNMRRHPLSSLRAFGPRASPPSSSRYRLSPRVLRKNKNTRRPGMKTGPSIRLITLALPRGLDPRCRVLEPRPITRNRCAGFAKVCHPETIRLLVAFHRTRPPKVYRSRLASESRTSNGLKRLVTFAARDVDSRERWH